MQVVYVSQQQMKTLDPHPKVPVISFVEPEDIYYPQGNWLEVLQIKCHDITKETPPYVLFNKEHARQIVDVVDKHKYPPWGIVVHCQAGVSRSGATAHFIANYHGYSEVHNGFSLEAVNSAPHINRHIFNLLM